MRIKEGTEIWRWSALDVIVLSPLYPTEQMDQRRSPHSHIQGHSATHCTRMFRWLSEPNENRKWASVQEWCGNIDSIQHLLEVCPRFNDEPCSLWDVSGTYLSPTAIFEVLLCAQSHRMLQTTSARMQLNSIGPTYGSVVQKIFKDWPDDNWE